MNFLEAVKAMKEGKKVRRPDSYYLYLSDNFLFNEVNSIPLIKREDVEADDWEVVDEDKDWNLAKHKTKTDNDDGYLIPESYTPSNVKKCRDLILQDIFGIGEEVFGKDTRFNAEMIQYFQVARSIIHKRFGDLK